MSQRQRAKGDRTPLTSDERDGIVLAVNSAFRKLKNLYDKILPIFDAYGFRPPSAGVVARDLSEKIEAEIVRHCATFERGVAAEGHPGLARCMLEQIPPGGGGAITLQRAVLHGAVGELHAAFEHLDRALDLRDPALVYLGRAAVGQPA